MTRETITLTQVEQRRAIVLTQVREQRMDAVRAATVLGISLRHCRRLMQSRFIRLNGEPDLSLGEILERIHRVTIDADFEVDVRTSAYPSASYQGNGLTRVDLIPNMDQNL